MTKNDALELTIDDLMQPGVKILDGIAGAAKTSQTVRLLQENGIEYAHMTSTNRLKRDITERFGKEARTIASGLFQTQNGEFYQGARDVEEPVIILDEILQTSGNVLKRIVETREEKNYIICTDTKQMLSPGAGELMARRFEDLKNQDFVKAYDFDVTHRPVNDKTKRAYNHAYHASSDGYDLFHRLRRLVEERTATPETIPDYTQNDIFLCHTNDIEVMLYNQYGLRNRYDLDIIPKGMIASKDVKDVGRYPILAQKEAKPNSSYWQIGNVGSVIRYQGSEVLPEDRLYFYVEKGASPTNREIYTMLTRAKDLASICIVYIDMTGEKDIKLVSFQGLPIIKQARLVRDGYELTDRNTYYSDLRKANEEDPNVQYTDIVSYGHSISKDLPRPALPKGKYNAWTIARKMPYLGLTKPNLLLKTIDDTGFRGVIRLPLNADSQFCGNKWAQAPDDIRGRVMDPGEYSYGIDLISAYPHVWNNYGLPDGRTYRADMTGEVGLYLVTESLYNCRPGTIMTSVLYDRMKDFPYFRAVPIGSIDKLDPTEDKLGKEILAATKKTKESKMDVKKIQWGWFQKQYLEPVKFQNTAPGKREPTAYIIHEDHVYFMVMVFIASALASVIIDLKRAVTGDPIRGGSVVDCLYFNKGARISEERPQTTGMPDWYKYTLEAQTEGWQTNTRSELDELVETIKKAIPGYDWRLYEQIPNDGKNDRRELYSTQDPLPTQKEYKREYYKKYREKKKNAEN